MVGMIPISDGLLAARHKDIFMLNQGLNPGTGADMWGWAVLRPGRDSQWRGFICLSSQLASRSQF
jgi:hypothetical protein